VSETTPSIKIIYFTTCVTICSLYAAQPIQPVFQSEFQLNNLQAILFTTLIMAPLGVAPLFYGYILESFSAKVMVRWALFGLGLLELVFALTDSYLLLLAIRAIQGIMIPAILTSLISYVSYTSPRERVQHAIATYIAATIVGGFLGRFLSAFFTDFFTWRFFFFLLGFLLLLSSYLLRKMERDVKAEYARPKISEIVLLLRKRAFFWLYSAIFCLFFVFSALMNFLPFQLKQMNPASGEAGIGLLYLGYAMGISVCFNSRAIIRFFNNEPDAIRAGVSIFALGLLVFMFEYYIVMFVGMFVFCTGLFMAHSLLSGFVNKLAEEHKAIANGLYMSSYYTGGTFGSVVPGVVYEYFGWQMFLLSLLLVLGVAMIFIRNLKKAVHFEK
jgi:YNFM family putative membrane transporter